MNFRKNIILFFVVFVISLITSCANADSGPTFSPAPSSLDKGFLIELKEAVRSNDKRWVSSHINFPLTVTIESQKVSINNQEEFIKNYENIFNRKVKDALFQQNPDNLFKNWRGVMVGSGEIWFLMVYLDKVDGQKRNFYIVGINN